MPLATTVLAAKGATPSRSMLFLHGLLGTKSNWRGLARRFVDTRPDWAAVLVDLREHGESLGLPGASTVDQCARDLLELVTDAPIRGALGHSFGGKVAMRWVEVTTERVDELWVIDSSPSVRTTGAGEARRVLGLLGAAFETNPGGFADREAFTKFVVEHGESAGIADWLAMNLVMLPSGRRGMRLDFARLAALLDDYGATDTWGSLDASPRVGAVHMVLGGKSDVVDAADRERLEFLRRSNDNLYVHLFPESGHWVHVDAPARLFETLSKMY